MSLRATITSPKIPIRKFPAVTKELVAQLKQQTHYDETDLSNVVFALLLLGKTKEEVCKMVLKAREGDGIDANLQGLNKVQKRHNVALLNMASTTVLDVEDAAVAHEKAEREENERIIAKYTKERS